MSGFTIFLFTFIIGKNILEYAQIAQSEPKSMILNIEGRSRIYPFRPIPLHTCK